MIALPEVVVPVYNAIDALAACLNSLCQSLTADCSVQLIDDASPDRRVDSLIEAFERNAPCAVTVHRQSVNLGFVGTVNAALVRAHRDVVLLNADTVTTRGWLHRIAACAASDPTIATITPWSNNAEICSFPEFCRNNPLPEDLERIAAACATHGPPTYPELPTAVGFCMFLRRAAWLELGDFDAETFGRGYGEENDFCMRSSGHGWRHVLCDDTYVAHRGGASFAAIGMAPGGANMARLLARYPGYNALIADFIVRDPLAPLRARINMQLRPGSGAPHN